MRQLLYNNKWAARLNYLAAIEPGWYDGFGEAIKAEPLRIVNELLLSLDCNEFTVPAMFPHLEYSGSTGLSLEWSNGAYLVSFQVSELLDYEIFAMNLQKQANEEEIFLETQSLQEAVTTLRSALTAAKMPFKSY